MTESQVYAELATLFQQVFDDDGIVIEPDMTADDVEGWDSAKMIELIVAAQDHFGVKLSSREVDGLNRVDDLARLILEKTVR